CRAAGDGAARPAGPRAMDARGRARLGALRVGDDHKSARRAWTGWEDPGMGLYGAQLCACDAPRTRRQSDARLASRAAPRTARAKAAALARGRWASKRRTALHNPKCSSGL